MQTIIDILETLLNWVKEIVPVENSKSRFGNPAFRTFYEKVKSVSNAMGANFEVLFTNLLKYSLFPNYLQTLYLKLLSRKLENISMKALAMKNVSIMEQVMKLILWRGCKFTTTMRDRRDLLRLIYSY